MPFKYLLCPWNPVFTSLPTYEEIVLLKKVLFSWVRSLDDKTKTFLNLIRKLLSINGLSRGVQAGVLTFWFSVMSQILVVFLVLSVTFFLLVAIKCVRQTQPKTLECHFCHMNTAHVFFLIRNTFMRNLTLKRNYPGWNKKLK